MAKKNNNDNKNNEDNKNKLSAFIKDLGKLLKNKDSKGVIELFKNSNGLLKSFSGALGGAFNAIKGFINVLKVCVDTLKKAVESWKDVTNLSVRNNTSNFNDKLRAKGIEQLNIILTKFNNITDMLYSGLLQYLGLMSYLNNALNNLDKYIAGFITGNKYNPNSVENQSTYKQRDESLKQAISSARISGADNKTANTMGKGVNALIASIIERDVDGLTYDSVSKAVQSAVFSGDTKELQKLGFAINDYNLKAGMYGAGFDVSGNTQYMDSALAGGRLSVLEKLVSLSDEQLQEMTKQGKILSSINQNFAWEEVEAISSVNTDTGHYDKSGEFVVSNNANAEDMADITKELTRLSNSAGQFYNDIFSKKLYMTDTRIAPAGSKEVDIDDEKMDNVRKLGSKINTVKNSISNEESGLKSTGGLDVNVKVQVDTNDDKFKAYVRDVGYESNYKNFAKSNNERKYW